MNKPIRDKRLAKKPIVRDSIESLPAIAMDIQWSEQHLLVVGLGESGFACCRWLLRKGARITVIDSRTAPPMLNAAKVLAQEYPRLTIQTGVATPFSTDWLDGIQFLIPSPGISPYPAHDSPIAGLLSCARDALAHQLSVVGEIDLFEWAVHDAAQARRQSNLTANDNAPLDRPKILAITGTNGKTTTTQMTTVLLRRAGIDAQEAGNISPSLLDAVMMREDTCRFPQVWVLELSSFQLTLAQHFHPTAAVLLNLSEDHLDWHLDWDDYKSAKARVFGVSIDPMTSGVQCIVNRQDTESSACAQGQVNVTRFGIDLPMECGDFGLIEEGIQWMVVRDLQDAERCHRLMPADALRIRGRHNAMNALAALALCRTVTPALAPLLHGLREFRGGAHRMEWVAHVQGVDYVDDSKGTNVGATTAALEGLRLPVVLIAGGQGKGQDFQPLAAALQSRAKAVITIGEAGPEIGEIARRAGVPSEHVASMNEAVQRAHYYASQDDAVNTVVMMSPACASFDMFSNYIARARSFRESVAALAQEQGLTC